ncbi:unnamed protein product, partial [Oppiella nova]
MYAWEESFSKAIGDARRKEMSQKYLLLDEMDMKEVAPSQSETSEKSELINKEVNTKYFHNDCINMDSKTFDSISVNDMSCCWRESTFLMSLMNELRITCGSLQLNGTIAYVSQESWVFNANVKQNIIFDKQYEEK